MKKQKGAALVVSLVLLVAALLLGLSSAQSSRLEEAMAGNYRASLMTLSAAESGVSDALNLVNNDMSYRNYINTSHEHFDSLPICSELDLFEEYDKGEFISSGLEGSQASSLMAGFYFCKNDSEDSLVVASIGSINNDYYRLIMAKLEGGLVVKAPFKDGLLSADYIRVTGNSTVHGGIHANGYVDIKLTNSSEATITDGISSEKVEVPLPGSRPSDEDDVYKIYDESIFDSYEGKEGVNFSCEISVNGLSDGEKVFCDGDLTVNSGSVGSKKITLVATGSVTMNGATSSEYSDVDNAEVGLLVISGSNIDFNGSTDNFGVFWAAGSVRQNGNSNLYGSIVSGSYIRSNGGIDFKSLKNITNPDLMEVKDPRLVSWSEVLNY